MKHINKAELRHGAYYEGECRNATIARWNAVTNRFYYWRYKFGYNIIDDIKCPEDEEVYDVFYPHREIDVVEREIRF